MKCQGGKFYQNRTQTTSIMKNDLEEMLTVYFPRTILDLPVECITRTCYTREFRLLQILAGHLQRMNHASCDPGLPPHPLQAALSAPPGSWSRRWTTLRVPCSQMSCWAASEELVGGGLWVEESEGAAPLGVPPGGGLCWLHVLTEGRSALKVALRWDSLLWLP